MVVQISARAQGFVCALGLVVVFPVFPACKGGGGSPSAPTSAARSNTQPSVQVSVSPPGQAITAVTTMSFTASGSDPDGDPLSYSWDFGDGTSASGGVVNKVFNNPGTFNVTVTANDGRGGTATATQSVAARNLEGFWRGGVSGLTNALNIDQVGTRITGKAATGIQACGGRIEGTASNPRVVQIDITFTGAGCFLGPERYEANVESFLNTMRGTYFIGNRQLDWSFSR